MSDEEKEYWLQFRLKAIRDSVKFTLTNMTGKVICKFIDTKEIDWLIRDSALKEIMEDIEKWERQKRT